MIEEQNTRQGTHPGRQKCPEKTASGTQTHAARNASTFEDESDSELYGLARILRRTEDSASSSKHDDLSEQTNNKDNREEETAPEALEKERGIFLLTRFARLNRRLLIYKTFYFFFFSAIGSLFPYLAVFYKQLWLSAHETGILIGIRPLIQLFGTPMWGVIADTFKKSKVIFMVSLIAWLVSNYSLSLVSPVFHLGVCKDNATMGIIQEILEEQENKTVPVKNSSSASNRQKQKAPITVNPGKGSENWFEIVGKVKGSNSSKRTTYLRNSTNQNQLQSLHLDADYQNASHNALNSSKDYPKMNTGGQLYSSSRSKILHHIHSSPVNTKQRLRRNIESSELSGTIITFLNSLNKQLINGDKLRRSNMNSKDFVSESDSLRLLPNSSKVDILEESGRQVNIERLERVFDSLNMAGEYPWPLDTVANYDLTQTSFDWKNLPNTHLFTILFVITAIGTLIAAPAITLADTATLQNLGNCCLIY